jgi:hypothetical protein
MVKGQRARANPLLVGITTAGDDDSELLLTLYKQGEQAIAGEHERFGFFCWEAPEGATIDTPGAIEAANPAVACGRIDVETVRSDERTTPEADQIRYTLNRFTSSTAAAMPLGAWTSSAGLELEPHERVIYTFERTRSWEYGSIVAAAKGTDGLVWTELVASIVRPNLDQLVQLADQLRARGPATFAMDGLRLSALAKQLEAKGYETRVLRAADATQCGPSAYSLITAGKVRHAEDPLVTAQMRAARRKNVGESWRISSAESAGDVDAVLATVEGIYLAESTVDPGDQIF